MKYTGPLFADGLKKGSMVIKISTSGYPAMLVKGEIKLAKQEIPRHRSRVFSRLNLIQKYPKDIATNLSKP